MMKRNGKGKLNSIFPFINLTKNLKKMKNTEYKMTVRKLKIQCTDSIGQVSTFTVNENGVQNSPSFKSLTDLSNFSLKANNYAFRAELKATNGWH